MRYGWWRLYDLHLQSVLLASYFYQPYLNPPVMAWATLPFVLLPFVWAHAAWTALLLVSLLVAWWVLCPAGQGPRWWWLLAVFAWLPAMFSIGIAQPQFFVVLAIALAVRLRSSDREFWAGVALSVIWLKPQLGFLVPVGLLAARQWRMLLGLAVAGGLLGLAQLAALRPAGVRDYLDALQLASTFELQRRLSLVGLVPGVVFNLLRVVIVGLLVLASLGSRRRDYVLVAAPLASLLVAPYSGFQDLAVLCGSAWIWLRESPSWGVRSFLLLGWVCAEFTLLWGPYPLVGFELAWMVVLGVLGVRRWRAGSSPSGTAAINSSSLGPRLGAPTRPPDQRSSEAGRA
ncbi:MAG TPA: glycosyltransferase family 87 protein [Candidatus Dormibacteraeota bacterium]|nr:glycosyltransferase family 87 protein [Candidatus Dormibacteraeota bacterium]